MSDRNVDLARRRFLKIGGGVVATGALAPACNRALLGHADVGPVEAAAQSPGDRWAQVRGAFDLDPEYAHFGGFLLASHPRPVREAIEGYRQRLDRNPVLAVEELLLEHNTSVRAAAERFVGAKPGEVALTDSTTMGLGLVYGGFALRAGQEILTTEYGHYSTHESLRFRAERDGVPVVKVALFEHSARASEAEIVERLMAGVTDNTRIVAVTWVHSMSGVRMPIPAIAAALARRNEGRAEADRALLCVDGVHGLGVVPLAVDSFGADFFIAGTHKWVFGPRGTGLVWGREQAWSSITPTVPPFEIQTVTAWRQGKTARGVPGGVRNTPGGFHSFEHRWALPAAFDFQNEIGRENIATRIHALNRQLKEGLADMPKVELFTPMSDELSAGITCFMVDGMDPKSVVHKLLAKKIIATTTPYVNTYARLAPGLLNNPQEVDRALAAIHELA